IGPSHILVHEVGHHVGVAHPHDGFDLEDGVTFQPYGDFFFAWTGDESATVMSYIHSENDFSRFDIDSMGRWMTVGYMNQANQILAKVFKSRFARREDAAVVAADQAALRAVIAYFQTDYTAAATHAQHAYDLLLGAAARLQIPIEPQAAQADVLAQSPNGFFVDPVDPFGANVARMRPTTPVTLRLPALPAEATGWTYLEP
ncbi:MAG: hypothetical protein ACRDKT_14850, partial [Actinomycetota bacterium]